MTSSARALGFLAAVLYSAFAPAAPMEVTSSDGSYFVTANPSVDPLPLNEMFALRIDVTSKGAEPPTLRVDELTVDARMPGHGHGMNSRPQIKRLTDASFVVDGLLLHMPGEWKLEVNVRRGDRTEKAVFPIVLE